MSPGVIITAFIVSLLLVVGNKSDKPSKDKKATAVSGPVVFTSVEELAQLLDSAEDSELVIVKPGSKSV
ncbi:MAG: hypothetical protein AAFU71_04040 [Cyanobacteria bacterium J06632_22]